MRIHIQNLPGNGPFTVTPAQWEQAVLRARVQLHDHTVSFGLTEAGLARSIRDAEALICDPTVIRSHFPVQAPKLRLIFCTSAGLEKLAPFDWLPSNVTLLNNRGAHGAKASEYVLMGFLMLSNHMPEFAADQQAQRWQPRFASVLRGRRVCMVGMGTIGSAVAELAAGFGMRVTGVRKHPTPHPSCERVVDPTGLDTVLPETDFLALACPLTPATRHLICRRRLGLLQAHAGIVNVGRGAVLDEAALCDLLDAGRLGGAVLDVFSHEPVPPGDRLWTTRNLAITPHVSADDPATYNTISLDIFFANLRELAAGRPLPNAFDPVRGY